MTREKLIREFVKQEVHKSLSELLKKGYKRTQVYIELGKEIGVSHITLYNVISQGKVSNKTIGKMVDAGWFSYDDINDFVAANKDSNTGTGTNDNARNYKAPKSKPKDKYTFTIKDLKAQYQQGYSEGYDKGYSEGYEYASPDLDKIDKLLRLNNKNNSTAGETQAARIAIGKLLTKWATNRFKQPITIKVSDNEQSESS